MVKYILLLLVLTVPTAISSAQEKSQNEEFIKTLKSHNKLLEEKVESLEEEHKKLENEKDQLNQSVQERLATIQKLTAEKSELEKRIAALDDDKFKELRAKNKKLTQQIKSNAESIEAFEKQLDEYNKSDAGLRSEIEGLERDLEILQKDSAQLHAMIDECQVEQGNIRAAWEMEIKTSALRLNEKDSVIRQKDEEIEKLNARLETYQNLIKQETEDIVSAVDRLIKSGEFNPDMIKALGERLDDTFTIADHKGKKSLNATREKLVVFKKTGNMILKARLVLSRQYDAAKINETLATLNKTIGFAQNLKIKNTIEQTMSMVRSYCKYYKIIYQNLSDIDLIGIDATKISELNKMKDRVSHYPYLVSKIEQKQGNLNGGNPIKEIPPCN